MRNFLMFLFLLVGITVSGQVPADSVSVKPTGVFADTAYYHVAFAVPNKTVKVQPARFIVRYVTFPTYNQPVEQYWEVSKGRVNVSAPNKSSWIRSSFTTRDVIWVQKIQ